jgi:hypothetical protein
MTVTQEQKECIVSASDTKEQGNLAVMQDVA